MSEMLYIIQRIVTELVLPPFGPLLLLIVASLLARRYKCLGRSLQITTCLLLYVLACQGFGARMLDKKVPPASITPPYPDAQAVVILGGGRSFSAHEYGGESVSTNTLARLRFGATVARATGKPILVSGGKPGNLGEKSEAALMAAILTHEFQLPVRWVEGKSNNTDENATFSTDLLQKDGVSRIYLVTQVNHMPRAQALFEAEGMDVVPMPTGFNDRLEPSFWLAWTPSFSGLGANRSWLYEALAKVKSLTKPSPAKPTLKPHPQPSK